MGLTVSATHLSPKQLAQLSLDFPEKPPEAPLPPEKPSAELLVERAYDAAREWSAELAKRMGRGVRLVITDNRRTVLSAQEKGGRMEIRLHHIFLEAGDEILDAVARYLIHHDKVACEVIDAFVENNRDRVVASAARTPRLQPQGKHYDLQKIFDSLAIRCFGEGMDAKITWGRRVRPKRGQRSLQLGNYVPDERLIRIHPALDQSWVPEYVVEGVVYHEMLHHDLPAVVNESGQHRFHTAAFRKRERLYEHHDAAEKWEKENFWRLLRGK